MTAPDDHMAPDASPNAVLKKTGIRRVNNMPLYLLGAGLGIFLIIAILAGVNRAEKQNEPAQDIAERAGNTLIFAKEIVGDKEGGIVEATSAPTPPEMPTTPETNPVLTIARPDNLDLPPRPPSNHPNAISSLLNGSPARSSEHDEETQRIRMAKLHMFEEAVKARTAIRVNAPRSSGSSVPSGMPQTRDEILSRLATVRQEIDAQRSTDPTTAYQQRLAQIRASGLVPSNSPVGGVGNTMPQLLQTSGEGQNKSYSQFAESNEGDRWQLNTQPEAPRSPYELRAGSVIPATLISGINADLPGQIIAQIAQPVYDTPTGRYLLLPQGSRLIGTYSSEIAYGQNRILIAWQRIIFPDGKAMDIGTMPGADSAGYAGFNDRINNHYWRVFSSAFLMSGVIAGVNISQDKSNSSNNSQRASDAMSEALGQVLGQTISQMVSRNLNIAPVLEIRPGYRFNVTVTKDMTFSKPYQHFDY